MGCHHPRLRDDKPLLAVLAGAYLTKIPGNPGAGDLLMGVLGSVILSFAFSMYKQRKVCSPNQKHYS